MKLRLLIRLAGLFMAGKSFALPPCPKYGVWHNCFGSYTFANGEKYVGEWRDSKYHGQGAATFPDGP
ncbi:MAG: hypothetical protein VW493_10195 [Gammaproteobacteria bacterium]